MQTKPLIHCADAKGIMIKLMLCVIAVLSLVMFIPQEIEDGSEVIRFTPVPLYETEPCINAICENYNSMMEDISVDPLLIIPVFLHDFLCIHPFNDGNGRMSRLMTLLLLYKSGYLVGKYISIEKHIEKTKDAYYDALEASSSGWQEDEDPTVFVKYMLGVILACYREIVNICPSISEKSVEAALKKLLDEGYVIKHGLGKNTFYSKAF